VKKPYSMKTSSTDLRRIERYVLHKLSPGERLVFSARLVLDADLRQALTLHRQTLELINAYARRQQKKKLNIIHDELFSQPSPALRKALALFAK